jgi:hypothetical protein
MAGSPETFGVKSEISFVHGSVLLVKGIKKSGESERGKRKRKNPTFSLLLWASC